MYKYNGTPTDGNAKKMIENYSYGLNSQIGKGFSSKVFKGQNELNGDHVAIKVIDKALLKTPLHHALLQSEIESLSILESQYIMKLYKVFQTQNNTYLITEFCEGGDLGTRLTKHGKFPEQQVQNIMFGVVKAYKLLKQSGIIHRDIKPANILLTACQTPKLADFGFATTPNSPPLLPNVNVGSPLYMSPQALKNNKYSDKSDIWAIAVSAYELVFGQVPWQATSEKDLAQKMLTMPVTFPSSVKVSQEFKDFIRRSLVVNENERANIDELEKHNWFKGPELSFQPNLNKPPALLKSKTLEIKEGKENSTSISKRPYNDPTRGVKKHLTQAPRDRKAEEQQNQTEYVLLSQINFCRYLQRVATLIEQTNIFTTEQLQQKLLFFVVKNIMMKINKLRDLDSNPLNLAGFEYFKGTASYTRIQEQVQHYYQKYNQNFKAVLEQLQGNRNVMQQDKKFDAVFDENFTEFESFYIIFNSMLRQGVKELHKEIDRKLSIGDDVCKSLPMDLEKEVVLLDYMVTYYQLSQLILDTFSNPVEFATKSKIEHIADGSPVRLTYGHFVEIRNKMTDLEI